MCFSVSLSNDGETEYAKQQKKISSLKEQLVALEKTCSRLNQEIKNKHQAVLKGKEERDKLRYKKRRLLSYKVWCEGNLHYSLSAFQMTFLIGLC